jgi:aerobic carbon-monoxide dehydrogenase medium subunit
MKPPRFEYFSPETLGEAISLLERYTGDARVLAGGQSLMPLLNMRLARPAALVDINKIAELGAARPWAGGVSIGATVRQRALQREPLITQRLPIVLEIAPHIGHQQIRSRGTICGSIAHADPAAELPALALAMAAEMVATGPRGERTIAAADFYRGYLTTALETAEILTEVRFSAPPPAMAWSFIEVSRRHGDFALVGVIAGLSVDGVRGTVQEARIVHFGVGPNAKRTIEAERTLVGARPDEDAFRAAGEAASRAIEPETDVHATAEYRRSVAGALTRRALHRAWDKLRVGGAA